MLQEERFNFIISELTRRGAVTVADLSEALNTSQSTIRRDISELDGAGRLKKVFGGAVPLENKVITVDYDFAVREKTQSLEKAEIGRFAASLIEKGDFIYIDAGTTTAQMIPHIDPELAGSINIVTNCLPHGTELAKRGFQVYMPGGNLKPATLALVGGAALEYVDRFYFSKCFMGANGVSADLGLTTPEIEEGRVKIHVVGRSQKIFALCDSSKFGNRSSVSFCKLNEAVIITEHLYKTEFRELAAIMEVRE